jgi:hypothetical protein
MSFIAKKRRDGAKYWRPDVTPLPVRYKKMHN